MFAKYVAAGTAVALVFILTPPVHGEEYELGYKVLDLSREDVYVMGQFLQPSTKPKEKLSAEPKYRSSKPIYLLAEFGNDSDSKYTFVLDESKGTGKGYDVLYLDRNNNENLTDDPKLGGRVRRQDPSYTTANFGPVEVMVDYGDRTVPYYFSIEYYRFGQARTRGDEGFVQNMSVRLRPGGYHTGVVSFGGSKRRIAVVDFNANGLFNEYFKPLSNITGSGGSFYAMGDQILIDVDGDDQSAGGYPDFRELNPYAKYVQVDGRWYSLDVAAHGAKVEVQAPRLKLGTLRIPAQLGFCSVQLLSEDGVFKVGETGKDFQVPAGTYQLYAHTTEATHSSGNWRYDAKGTASGKKFEVAEGEVLPLRFGPPLLVNVSHYSPNPRGGQAKAGDTIQLSLTLSGQGGEAYTNIVKNGTRPPAPTYKIVDEAGKIVDKGTFEYG